MKLQDHHYQIGDRVKVNEGCLITEAIGEVGAVMGFANPGVRVRLDVPIRFQTGDRRLERNFVFCSDSIELA